MVTIGASGLALTFIAVVANPEQLVPEEQVALYVVVALGFTFNVELVPITVKEVPCVQEMVPVQLVAVSVTSSPSQIVDLLAVTVGVWPKPPTVIILLVEAEQFPEPHETE